MLTPVRGLRLAIAIQPSSRWRKLMTERAVHLPPRADSSPRSLSACAVAFAAPV